MKKDTPNELVSSAIRKNRFLEIHKYLHNCDNSQFTLEDKYAKLSFYFTQLKKSFQNNLNKEKRFKYSIDETMIHYYGKHEGKQHIHGKLIDFGYKIWSNAHLQGT